MVIFLYGPDTYRSKQKLRETVLYYQKADPSGLHVRYIDLEKEGVGSFFEDIRSQSLFAKRKLFVLQHVSLHISFQEELFQNSEKLVAADNIILFWEGEVSEKDKFFKFMKKVGELQAFQPLGGQELRNWAKQECEKGGVGIDPRALQLLLCGTGSDLWQLSGEIKKLAAYKRSEKSPVIQEKDIALLVHPKLELDIFQTIDAISQRNKKSALSFVHRHLERGDSPLYLFSMINFQLRNLLAVKSLESKHELYANSVRILAQKLGMHPFVIQKARELSRKFSLEELKKIYQKVFQIDFAVKTGRADLGTALDMLITEM